MSKEKLLREFVKQVLKEDDFGGFGGEFGGPYGMDFTGGDQSKLAKVFLTPFTDVIDTAAGKGKELSTKAQTLGKVAFEALATTFIPILGSDFNQIFADEKENLERIQGQYKQVYDRTWTAIKDNDVLSAAFMAAPALMITAATARKAPVPVLNTIGVLAGGKLDGFLDKVKKKLQLGDEEKMLDTDTGPSPFESVNRQKNLLTEKIDVGKVLTQKKIRSTIEANPEVQRMQKETRAAIRKTLETLFDRINRVSKARSVDELQKIFGKQVPGVQKLQEVPQEERQAMEQAIVQSVKQGAKSMYIKHLQAVVNGAQQAGVPDNHPLLSDYSAAINKIKSL